MTRRDMADGSGPGTRALIGKLLLFSAAVMFVGAGALYAGLGAIHPDLRGMLTIVLAGVGILDALMAVYFIRTDPSS